MKLQTIKSSDGKDEYVLLPMAVYRVLKQEIEGELKQGKRQSRASDYVPFRLEDYVENPIALARMKARFTQEELADRMGVSQAYISKIERQEQVTAKLLERVRQALRSR